MGERAGVVLKSNGRLKALMAAYFADLAEAEGRNDRPVAWCTSVGPAELLRAMGFAVFFPENHGAMLGATRMAAQTMPQAHALGYSPDICSYLTSDIGAFASGVTPLTNAFGMAHVPRPSVLVYNTNQCREVKDWFSWYGRTLDVPVLGIQSPGEMDEVLPEMIRDVSMQLQRIARDLAPLAPRSLTTTALEATMALSSDASAGWSRCLKTAARRPTPWTFFDHTIHMAPIVVLRGTQEAVEYYRGLSAELESLSSPGGGAVPRERFRIYWDGMPIWGQLRRMSELFSASRAAVVASTYCNSWVFPALDARDPWESMARAYLSIFICRSEAFKQDYIVRTAREFGARGILFHDAKTCPHNTNSRFGMPRRIREAECFPVLVIEGDLNDPRCFSYEESRVRLEVFLEQMEEGQT